MPPLRCSSVRSKAWLRGMSFWSPIPMTFSMTNHRQITFLLSLFLSPFNTRFFPSLSANVWPPQGLAFRPTVPLSKWSHHQAHPPLACPSDMLLSSFFFPPLKEWQSYWVTQSPSATEQEAECGKWQWQEDFKHGWMTGCERGVKREKLQEDQMSGRPGQGLDFPWKHNKDSFLK